MFSLHGQKNPHSSSLPGMTGVIILETMTNSFPSNKEVLGHVLGPVHGEGNEQNNVSAGSQVQWQSSSMPHCDTL